MNTWDCTMLFNELDMLATRMHILDPVVDFFVVCEAAETHSGQPKPYYLQRAIDHSNRFNPFLDKLIYVKVDNLTGPGRNSWEREYFQRSCIARGLVDAQPDALVIVADVDEIPNPDTIKMLVDSNAHGAKLEMSMYYYDLNHRTSEGWAIGALRWIIEKEPNNIRRLVGHDWAPQIWNAGWHFSYMGGPEMVLSKIESFMHWNDVARDIPRDADWIKQRIDAGQDLYARPMQIEQVPLSDTLPRYILEHANYYRQLGWILST